VCITLIYAVKRGRGRGREEIKVYDWVVVMQGMKEEDRSTLLEPENRRKGGVESDEVGLLNGNDTRIGLWHKRNKRSKARGRSVIKCRMKGLRSSPEPEERKVTSRSEMLRVV